MRLRKDARGQGLANRRAHDGVNEAQGPATGEEPSRVEGIGGRSGGRRRQLRHRPSVAQLHAVPEHRGRMRQGGGVSSEPLESPDHGPRDSVGADVLHAVGLGGRRRHARLCE